MSDERRDFDKEAASWDEPPYRLKLARDIASAIKGQVQLASDMDVMDFGCGTGLLTLELQPLVRSINGVDSSRGMLDVLNEKIAALKPGNVKTTLVPNEMLTENEALAFGKALAGTAGYHLIVSSMALHHVRDVPHLFRWFHEILVPSGRLSFADLDVEDGRFHGDNTGVFHFGFDRTELRRTLGDAGFDDVRDMTATTMTRQGSGGEKREFPIFLMTGRKK